MKAGSVGSRFPNTLLTFGVAESTLTISRCDLLDRDYNTPTEKVTPATKFKFEARIL